MKKAIPALIFALTALLPFCVCAKNGPSNTKTGGTAMNITSRSSSGITVSAEA